MNEECSWHLVCITRLGKVSILKNLDLRTAAQTYQKLKPETHPFRYKEHRCKRGSSGRSYSSSSFGRSYGPTDDWLDKVEAIGPEGLPFDPWQGVEPRTIDLFCGCGCRNDPETPEIVEDRRLAELAAAVPSAFWLPELRDA